MQKLGMKEGEAIENAWVSRAIENAQRKVEAHNFDVRKQLLEYDDVANDQRRVIYEQRSDLLTTEDVSDTIGLLLEDVMNASVSIFVPPGSIEEEWDIPGLTESLKSEFSLDLPLQEWLDSESDLHEESLRERIIERARSQLDAKLETIGADLAKRLQRDVMLQVLDSQWKEHLASMDYLRQGIGLRGYAQKNPKQEYKREAFEMFEGLLERIKHDVIQFLLRLQLRSQSAAEEFGQRFAKAVEGIQLKHDRPDNPLRSGDTTDPSSPSSDTAQPFRREGPKLGRNDPCWCGSGKKYKHCHGKLS